MTLTRTLLASKQAKPLHSTLDGTEEYEVVHAGARKRTPLTSLATSFMRGVLAADDEAEARAALSAARVGATNYDIRDWGVSPGVADNAAAIAAAHLAVATAGGGVLHYAYTGTATCTSQATLFGSNVTHRGHRNGTTLRSTLAGDAFLVGGTASQQLEIGFENLKLSGAYGQKFFRARNLRTMIIRECVGTGIDGLVGLGDAAYTAAYRLIMHGGEYGSVMPKTDVSSVVGTPTVGEVFTGPSGFSGQYRSVSGSTVTWYNNNATSPSPGETLTGATSGTTMVAGTTTRGANHFIDVLNSSGGLFMYDVEAIECGYDGLLDVVHLSNNASASFDQAVIANSYLGRARRLFCAEDVRVGNVTFTGNRWDEALEYAWYLNSTSSTAKAVSAKGVALTSAGDTFGSGLVKSKGAYVGSEDNRSGQSHGQISLFGLRAQGCNGPVIKLHTASGGLIKNFCANGVFGEEQEGNNNFIEVTDQAAVTGLIDNVQCSWRSGAATGNLIDVGGTAGTNTLAFGRNLVRVQGSGLLIDGGPVTRPGELAGSATYDPVSLADGAGVTTTVTVTGAALGDRAEATFSLDLQGVTLTAWVSATNTVSVRFQNETGGPLDLGSGTLRAWVVKV